MVAVIDMHMFGESAFWIPKMYVVTSNIQCCFNMDADRFLFIILFGSGKQTSCNMQILINIGE